MKTFQAEDEIAAVGVAIGASFGGAIGVTGTSGPGICLKSEAIGLAVMTELPLVIVDVQRGGPSTGLPTKTEQADLLQAMFGRNGECPVAIIAPQIAGRLLRHRLRGRPHRHPVHVPGVPPVATATSPTGPSRGRSRTSAKLPKIEIRTPPNSDGCDRPRRRHQGRAGTCFLPYKRDETLARPWAIPGTPGLEHRIGGIEKQDVTGNINYEPANHEHMVRHAGQEDREHRR